MLHIPLLCQGDQRPYLELRLEALPHDMNNVVYLLQREKVAIGYWLKVAVRLDFIIGCS